MQCSTYSHHMDKFKRFNNAVPLFTALFFILADDDDDDDDHDDYDDHDKSGRGKGEEGLSKFLLY